jgi:hypothetical protein
VLEFAKRVGQRFPAEREVNFNDADGAERFATGLNRPKRLPNEPNPACSCSPHSSRCGILT